MNIKEEINRISKEIAPKIREFRRYLHAHPELSLHEYKTAALLFEKLKTLGLQPQMHVDGRGVSALVEGKKSSAKTVALRADIDALPIQEKTGLPYASQTSNVMHACGHDGHTANLLGVAEILLALRPHFEGTVKLIFQPAEEMGGGARLMIQDGVLESPQVNAIFGLHGWPGIPVGHIAYKSGPILAANDSFTIQVRGKGGHAAYPEKALNPISAIYRLCSDLESIPSTRISTLDPAIVTVTTVTAGEGAHNVIPESGEMRGTLRSLSEDVRQTLKREIQVRAKALELLGFEVQIDIFESCVVTQNHVSLEPLVERVLGAQFDDGCSMKYQRSSMGGEDFSYYSEKVPAYFLLIGVGDRAPLHNPAYDFNDDSLPTGMALFTRLALEYLAEKT